MLSKGLFEGRYEILEPIGKDEVAATFLAHDNETDQQVALRSLRPSILADAALIEELEGEIRQVLDLRHDNICSLFEFHWLHEKNRVLLSMEFVQGDTLRDFLFRQPQYRCDEGTFRHLARQILSGIDHAHGLGIVHRDLTPDNILLTSDGVVKLLDFGIDAIIKEVNFKKSRNPIFLSTYYVSPELVNGEEPSPRMDIYSLGCVFYEMLAGKLPFNEKDLLHQDEEERAAPIEGVSEELNQVVLSCLEKDPEGRPQFAEEILEMLGNLPELAEAPAAAAAADEESAPEGEAALEREPTLQKVSGTEPAETRTPQLSLVSPEEPEEIPEEPLDTPYPAEETLEADLQPPAAPAVEAAEQTLPGAESEFLEEEADLFARQQKTPSPMRMVVAALVVVGALVVLWAQLGPVLFPGQAPLPESPPGPAQPAGEQTPGGTVARTEPTNPEPAGDQPPAPASEPGFTLQVGVFSTRAAAQRTVGALREKGHESRIVQPQGSSVFHVWVGQFSDRDQALRLSDRLQADGFQTYVKRTGNQP